MITIRSMESCELSRIAEIDRSEEISQEYVLLNGSLGLKDVSWSVSRWTQDGRHDHSVAGKIAKWRPWLQEGGTLFGAFDGEALVAFAIYRPRLSVSTAQFAVLHVSRPYRRQGIGAALADKVIESARNDGATQMCVSAIPTRGTIEFYQSLGFRPSREINRELLDLEPEDIQMTMEL